MAAFWRRLRRVVGLAERLILGAVMAAMLALVERLLLAPGGWQRAQRLARRFTRR